ncbi:MAG: hypothetical protein LBL61_01460 [Elusimicrobiota bacterium]|nr:hypothetical protein [Elusimicrobiota bacterium]
MENEAKRQHLEFIQDVITRMNANSFQIKEISVLLATACFAIYAADKVSLMLLIPVLPTVILWCLDTYYLQQERKFRGIYEDVAGIKNNNIIKPYEMPIQKYTPDKNIKYGFLNVMRSQTLILFYLPLIILSIFLFVFVSYGCMWS